MAEINKKLKKIQVELEKAWSMLNIDEKTQQLRELEEIVNDPELWRDPDNARQKNEQLAHLHNEIEPWNILRAQISDIDELLELNDEGLEDELDEQIEKLEQQLLELKKALRFNGKFDHNDAILRITAGVGGTEAMDWASMLERMYLRWAERKDFKVTCLERNVGEEAGIKTVVYEVHGVNAYGLLKSEHGVHRLVRLSPFNADNLRQTSFALVEVLPVLEDNHD